MADLTWPEPGSRPPEALLEGLYADDEGLERRLAPLLAAHGHVVAVQRDMARHQVAVLRAAVQRVLDDDETGAGGWGPDVTCAYILKEAMEATE